MGAFRHESLIVWSELNTLADIHCDGCTPIQIGYNDMHTFAVLPCGSKLDWKPQIAQVELIKKIKKACRKTAGVHFQHCILHDDYGEPCIVETF